LEILLRILVLFSFALAVATLEAQPLTAEAALRLAVQNRPMVMAARQRVAAARHNRRALTAIGSTRLLAGYSSSIEIGATDDDLVVAQELDIFGRRSSFQRVGDAGIARAEAELRLALATIQEEVLDQLSEAVAAKALAENAAQTQDIVQRLHEAIKSLFEEGRVPGVQVTRVGIEVERAKLAAERRKAEMTASIQRLNGLLHIPTGQIEVGGFELLLVDAVPASLEALAELQILAADVQAAEAETRVVRLSSLPELELQGRTTPWQERDRRYGLRVQLTIPLLDHGKVRSETAAASSRTEAARKSLEDATRQARAAVEASRTEMNAAAAEVTRYQAIADSAHSLVNLSRLGFDERAITLTELLEATRSLREVEEGLIEARLRHAKAQARYLRASGHILEVGK
jgi:cobalt-zinc-cadmium efflux system outer membrane protein